MKKRITVVIAFLLVISILSSCTKTDNLIKDNIVATNMIKYNLQGVADFGFNINFITSDKNAKVDFISFSGENTQGISVKLCDDTYENIKNLKVDGYYIRLLGFVCNSIDERVRIDSVKLKINGEEKEFVFDTPIEHFIKEYNENVTVQIKNYPLFISTNSIDSTEYSFEYYTDDNVTITDFSFNDFFDVENAVISVNGDTKGSLKDYLPIDITADSNISVKCNLKIKDSNTTLYDSVYCDSVLSYLSNGETATTTNNLICQSVSNEDDAKKVIELLTQK